jgi:hypothetical protein
MIKAEQIKKVSSILVAYFYLVTSLKHFLFCFVLFSQNIRSERGEAKQQLNLAKKKVEETAITLALLNPTNTKTTFVGKADQEL